MSGQIRHDDAEWQALLDLANLRADKAMEFLVAVIDAFNQAETLPTGGTFHANWPVRWNIVYNAITAAWEQMRAEEKEGQAGK